MGRFVLVLVLLCTLGAVVPATAAAAPPSGMSEPVYSYADAVRETAYVRAPFDSDGDGQDDRIAVDIVRPAEPAAQHGNVPVIMDASPYYHCCGRGNELETKTYAASGTITKLPLFYDNYFVPRGYAVAEVDLPGSARSTGCGDLGGPAQVLGAKAVIDWITGRGTAVDAAGKPVTASWSNGRVGMIGKSWDGTIANGVAATGVPGLKTIVPISAISSWYDYTRYGGVLRDTKYVSSVSEVVNDRPKGTCEAMFAAAQRAADDRTGNYNRYWAARNYRPDATRVRASVFAVHGLHDANVTTGQFASWWKLLGRQGVARKVWLSQDGHVDPFDYRRGPWIDTLHRWFDHYLLGLDNGITRDAQADVQQASGRWLTQSQWPAVGTAGQTVRLSSLGGTTLRRIVDHPDLDEAAATARPSQGVAGRTVFATGVLPRTLRVAGSPSLHLRIRSNRPDTELTARLVDYGRQHRVQFESDGEGVHTLTTQSCTGESTATDDACYYRVAQDYVTSSTDVLTRGWLSAAHHRSLSRYTPLTPHRWYDVTIPINATDALLPRGHRLAVVLTLSDREFTHPTHTGATVVVDPRSSALRLPVTGAYRVPTGPRAPADVTTPATVGRPGSRSMLLPG